MNIRRLVRFVTVEIGPVRPLRRIVGILLELCCDSLARTALCTADAALEWHDVTHISGQVPMRGDGGLFTQRACELLASIRPEMSLPRRTRLLRSLLACKVAR